jgi:hypothetical protein
MIGAINKYMFFLLVTSHDWAFGDCLIFHDPAHVLEPSLVFSGAFA